ncbi:MAG: hypothetical protein RIM72_00345 [Alphaproteobacteria bacterium]
MAKSIKIPDEAMEIVKQEARLQSRSLAGQMVHWMNIGRAIEQSGTFNYQHIRDALAGTRSPDALTAEEQDVFLAEFGDKSAHPSEKEQAFFENRRKQG